MGKLTADESFDTYQKIKAVAEAAENDGLWAWRENFFLDINDYDMWSEGEDVPYHYPWTADVAADLRRFNIKRTGTEVRYNGQTVTIEGTTVHFDGVPVGQMR